MTATTDHPITREELIALAISAKALQRATEMAMSMVADPDESRIEVVEMGKVGYRPSTALRDILIQAFQDAPSFITAEADGQELRAEEARQRDDYLSGSYFAGWENVPASTDSVMAALQEIWPHVTELLTDYHKMR